MSAVSGAGVDRASWADAVVTAPSAGTNPNAKRSPDKKVFRTDPNKNLFRMESNATLRIQ